MSTPSQKSQIKITKSSAEWTWDKKMWSKKRAECLLFLSLHTRQRITQQWGHSARHSHDTGRDRRTQSQVKSEGQRSFIHQLRHRQWLEVDVDVLGKQWMIPVHRTRGTDSHWFYFSTKIRRLTRPIITLKTSSWLNPSSQLSWPLKTKEFRQQTKLCICRQYGQFKGNVNIHHRKGEFPSMALSFFVIIKNYPKRGVPDIRIFSTLVPKQMMGSLCL